MTFNILPTEIIIEIFENLDYKALLNAKLVCKNFNTIIINSWAKRIGEIPVILSRDRFKPVIFNNIGEDFNPTFSKDQEVRRDKLPNFQLNPCFAALRRRPKNVPTDRVRGTRKALLKDLGFISRLDNFTSINVTNYLEENATSPAVDFIHLKVIWDGIGYSHEFYKGGKAVTVSDIIEDVLAATEIYSSVYEAPNGERQSSNRDAMVVKLNDTLQFRFRSSSKLRRHFSRHHTREETLRINAWRVDGQKLFKSVAVMDNMGNLPGGDREHWFPLADITFYFHRIPKKETE